ncbi:MAG TPA: Hsp20/alpha crystallin family protein [Verrucomicrobiae bacterium]|nr:Hsp20/alpha crystallin family protein [Verrucomicrobiae bacterium]
MNRLFTNLLSNFAAPLSSMMASPAAADFDFMPTADMEEKDNLYIVKVDLPGLDKDQINITVRDGLLTIEGVRKSESESKDDKTGFYSQERSYGSFSRSLPLPGPVDDAGIKADYANGVLTIQLPKKPGTEKNATKVSVQ